MSLSSSPLAEDAANQAQPTGKIPRRRWPIFLALIALLLIVAVVCQILYQQQTGMIAGKPLASRQTHLHDVEMSEQAGVVYLGTHFGLFTSTDGGKSWPQQEGTLNTAMITSVAVSPTNPHLLAVLAVPRVSGDLHTGIYVSTDGSKSWHFTLPAGLPTSAYPYTIQAASGANGHFFVFFAAIGWFETHDLGQHWSAITPQSLATMQTSRLLVDAHNPAHLLIGGDQGLFQSENDGQSWQQITTVGGSILSLTATAPANDGTRIILCATDQGLYRGLQQQQGIVWSSIQMPTSVAPARVAISGDGSALYALFGSDLWFSGDQGTTWVQRWHFTRGDLVALAINPNHPQQLLAGFFWPGLVLSSTNGGVSWNTLTD